MIFKGAGLGFWTTELFGGGSMKKKKRRKRSSESDVLLVTLLQLSHGPGTVIAILSRKMMEREIDRISAPGR